MKGNQGLNRLSCRFGRPNRRSSPCGGSQGSNVLKVRLRQRDTVAPGTSAFAACEAALLPIQPRGRGQGGSAPDADLNRRGQPECVEQPKGVSWNKRQRLAAPAEGPEGARQQRIHLGQRQIGFAKRVDEFDCKVCGRKALRLDQMLPVRDLDICGNHDIEVSATVHSEQHFVRKLKAPGEVAFRAANPFGDGVNLASLAREKREDAVRLAVGAATQHDG